MNVAEPARTASYSSSERFTRSEQDGSAHSQMNSASSDSTRSAVLAIASLTSRKAASTRACCSSVSIEGGTSGRENRSRMSWPEPVARVAAVLTQAAVDSRIEQFDEGTPTARAAAEAVGCELAQIVKSIVMVCDGSYVLALVPGDRRADEKRIARAVGAETVR